MPLITVAEAQRRRTLARVNDTLLGALLEAASDLIEAHCNRVFAAADLTETLDGNGVKTLFVQRPPINSVASIVVTDDAGDDETLTLSTDIVRDDTAGALTFGPDNASTFLVWPNGYPRNVAVAYNGGYATIPEAVQEACVIVATRLYAQTSSYKNPAFKTERMGEHGYTRIAYDEDPLTPAVKALLAEYVRMTFG